jgi:hypothetical protein
MRVDGTLAQCGWSPHTDWIFAVGEGGIYLFNFSSHLPDGSSS